MSIATDLLKAEHVGIRDLKEHLSAKLLEKVLIITDRGTPMSVSLPYSDVLELTDIIDEISDYETLTTIKEGRQAIRKGAEGIPVSHLFKRIRSKHNPVRT